MEVPKEQHRKEEGCLGAHAHGRKAHRALTPRHKPVIPASRRQRIAPGAAAASLRPMVRPGGPRTLLSTLLTAALTVAAVAAGPSAADAAARHRGARPVYSDPLAEAVARAVEFWGGTPCGGTVSITLGGNSEAPTAGENAPGAPGRVAAMWATWSTPAGPNLFSEPAGSFGECLVHINRGIWFSIRAEDSDFPAFCKEMLHEYGHFEGYSDVGAAPGTIEYERPDLARAPLCERYWLRYGFRLYSGPPHHSRPRARRR